MSKTEQTLPREQKTGHKNMDMLAQTQHDMVELIHASHRSLRTRFIAEPETGALLLRTTFNLFRFATDPKHRPVLLASRGPEEMALKQKFLPAGLDGQKKPLEGLYLKNPGDQRVVTARKSRTHKRFAAFAAEKYEQDKMDYNLRLGWLKKLNTRFWFNDSVMYWVKPAYADRSRKTRNMNEQGNKLYELYCFTGGDKEADPLRLDESRLEKILSDGMARLGALKCNRLVTLDEADTVVARDFHARENLVDRNKDPDLYYKESDFYTKRPFIGDALYRGRLMAVRAAQGGISFIRSLRSKDVYKLTATGIASTLYKNRRTLIQATSPRVVVLSVAMEVASYVSARIKTTGKIKEASDLQTFQEKYPEEMAPEFWREGAGVATQVPHYNDVDPVKAQTLRVLSAAEADVGEDDGHHLCEDLPADQAALLYISDIYSAPGGSVFEKMSDQSVRVNENNGLVISYLQTGGDHHVTYCQYDPAKAVKGARPVPSHITALFDRHDNKSAVLKVVECEGGTLSGVFLGAEEYQADLARETAQAAEVKIMDQLAPHVDDAHFTDEDAYAAAQEVAAIENRYHAGSWRDERRTRARLSTPHIFFD